MGKHMYTHHEQGIFIVIECEALYAHTPTDLGTPEDGQWKLAKQRTPYPGLGVLVWFMERKEGGGGV